MFFAQRYSPVAGKKINRRSRKNWMRFENKAAANIAFFLVMYNLRITLRPLVG